MQRPGIQFPASMSGSSQISLTLVLRVPMASSGLLKHYHMYTYTLLHTHRHNEKIKFYTKHVLKWKEWQWRWHETNIWPHTLTCTTTASTPDQPLFWTPSELLFPVLPTLATFNWTFTSQLHSESPFNGLCSFISLSNDTCSPISGFLFHIYNQLYASTLLETFLHAVNHHCYTTQYGGSSHHS